MTNTKTRNRVLICAIIVLIALSMLLPLGTVTTADGKTVSPFIELFEGDIATNMKDYLNSSVAYKLPDSVKDSDMLSVILKFDDETPLLDAYTAEKPDMTFTEYALSENANAYREHILAKKEELLSSLDGIEYETGAQYSAVLSGFEIILKAGDFETLCERVGDDVTPIVGEVYNPAETKLVENKVDVQDTGIFNTEGFPYDGTGIVVAVLDTGLDYYHSAFSTENFTADRQKLGLTYSEVAAVVAKTKAATLQSGLTASDVYINEKVPYGFDYADSDSDVFPIQSDHGTHVSGIIAGKDDTITGVAPNAQLVEMKIFSDVETTSRTSWIMGALEDCVILGVDVINLSIGTSCGFSRETDKEQVAGVYDKIRAAGISLVVAASNSFNSTYGSEKNGNLGLTSNPDSATVGSPSTYKGALCVASINGAKTPYILYGDTIIYFNESTDRVSEEKNFFDELLPAGQDSLEIEYVTIPGAGRSADYTGIDVTGKIVLVRRGSSTFEEKSNVAQEKGAAGVIIYNNVSGDIKMNVGETTIPVCSIRQDDGELLAAAGTGTIKVSRSQSSGPFMSDFSSWGPSPDLEIKPEITAHGGSILSAVPGQEYDRISGTSMATPNVSGLTALLRQYVKQNFTEIANDNVEVAAVVNRLLMSTADVVYNTNGLPYSVRKQGAGLANLVASAATRAYILTYDRKTGAVMDKSKIELGDDPQKTGVYTLKFSIENFGDTSLSYDFSSCVMTEGVSETKTNDGKTTVNEQGYILDGASVVISSVSNGTLSGNTISVGANQTADVTVTITLGESDKQYLNDSFENGMYVEGFLMLDAQGEAIDLGVPFLGFYGDWTEAPIFDIDYYATNKDELDDSIDLLDKTLPDAYATRPIGGISEDYVSYLGSYYFTQSPADVKIAADRKYISLSNQEGAIHALRFVWAGLLRNCQRIEITIVEDSTGEIVFEKTENDIRKSYGDGGSIYPANVEIEFDAAEYGLNNNTAYTVTLKGFLDYGDGGENTNDSNTFVFPLVTDFEAPAITDCEFYTEYDKTAKKNRLFAKIAIYDNHYAMAMNPGYIAYDATNGYIMNGFDQYMTPIYSEKNSTSYVVYELTDYIDEIKNESSRKNSFTVSCYDYALNEATYEIALPNEYIDMYFDAPYTDEEEGIPQIKLSPNEVYTLSPMIYPTTEWPELLDFVATSNAVRIVNNKLVAVEPGKTAIVVARDPVNKKQAMLSVYVYKEGEEGYKKFDKPVAENFLLTGYRTEKAYYFLDSEERDIGENGNERKFISENYSLSMYPSEKVMLRYDLDAYFPEDTKLVFESSNSKLVTVADTVDEHGNNTCYITAQEEGYASVSIKVLLDGKSTYYSKTISIEIKEPYVTSGPSLAHYYGLGGIVTIPDTLAITEIGQYAFSNFNYISKDPSEITEDSPETTKIWYIGDDTIETVIIPEGVERIGPYAFAALTKLKTVVLPSTLKIIDQGAFYGCEALTEVKGLEHVKFVNQNAFNGCNLQGYISLDSAVAIADYSFAGNFELKSVTLAASTQSVGAYAFAYNTAMESVTVKADKIKLGRGAFIGCKALKEAKINAAVLPAYAFDGCESLTKITIGKDVEVIGEYAFRSTAIERFTVESGNSVFAAGNDKSYIVDKTGKILLLVAPASKGEFMLDTVNEVADNAFSGVRNITSVMLKNVTKVGAYAFADCRKLSKITLGKLTHVGEFAFYETDITELPDLTQADEIGAHAFYDTSITSVILGNGVTVGAYAFAECRELAEVKLGDNVVLGDGAFALELYYYGRGGETNYQSQSYRLEDETLQYYYILVSNLKKLEIGDNAIIGYGAFEGASVLETFTLGKGAKIGERAFYDCVSLKNVDLSKAESIGDEAFSGVIFYEYSDMNLSVPAVGKDGNYVYKYYAPALESIDLSGVQSIGVNAFAYCKSLKSVKLGDALNEIAERAFYACNALESVNLSKVETVGLEAFAENALKSVDLSSVKEIGNYAFVYNEELTNVKLAETAYTIGEGAFSYCPSLENVKLENCESVGDYAFAYSAVTFADLSSAVYIGEHAFMKESLTSFKVILSEKLEEMGDNPFAYCKLEAFSTVQKESFNGNEYDIVVTTFDISEKVKVIDGMLYRVVPNGLELVSYAGNNADVSVHEDTVRISSMAFAASEVTRVTLPQGLRAIGHMAFYDCEKLTVVAFTSYEAPILEEAYDDEYFNDWENNIAGEGKYSFSTSDGGEVIFDGIGVVPYFIWNPSSSTFTVYFGANFVDRIGHVEAPIVMVKPVNGLYYDSFIINQYFGTVMEGAAAPDEITTRAIALINALPELVSLEDEADVIAARAAYDLITNNEQRALVKNYSKLTQAENRISNLKYLDQTQTPEQPGEPEEPTDQTGDKAKLVKIILISVCAAAIAAVVSVGTVFTVLYFRLKKSLKNKNDSSEAKENAEESENE